MAFELDVKFGNAPQNLRVAWTESYAQLGIDLEIMPNFDYQKWSGGFLPIKLSSLPKDYLFELPNNIQISGFEVDFSETSAHFRSANDRPMAEFILVCFGAALLTKITNGLYTDCWSGDSYKAEQAIEKAEQEIKSYKLDAFSRVQHQFPGWEKYQ